MGFSETFPVKLAEFILRSKKYQDEVKFKQGLSFLKYLPLFDEELDQRWGCEDLELGYRLYGVGAVFKFCEEGCNYHMAHFRKTFEDDLRFSIGKFFEKHKDSFIMNLPLLLLGQVKSVEEYMKICRQVEVGGG